jgi:hypothetical protein
MNTLWLTGHEERNQQVPSWTTCSLKGDKYFDPKATVSTILGVRRLARMGTFVDPETIMPVGWVIRTEPRLPDFTVSTLWFVQNYRRLGRELEGRQPDENVVRERVG